jgi:hypothetical protein
VGTTFRFIGDTGAGTIKALNLEELFPHIYGMVRYTDVFGQSVEIRFRYMWVANGWIVAAQQAGLTTVTAVETSIYGEWQKYGDEQDNYEGKPN